MLIACHTSVDCLRVHCTPMRSSQHIGGRRNNDDMSNLGLGSYDQSELGFGSTYFVSSVQKCYHEKNSMGNH